MGVIRAIRTQAYVELKINHRIASKYRDNIQ